MSTIATPLNDNTFNDPARRAPLLVGEQTAATVTEKVCGIAERRRPPPAWYVAFAITSSLTGIFFLLIGYLIYRSTFLPHILGLLMALAGVGWLVFLLPNLPNFVSVTLETIGICAEASLMLWLIARGVNTERWKQQSGLAEE